MNHTVPAGWSHQILIEQLSAHVGSPVLVERLSQELGERTFPRGRTVFGFVGNILDQIVRNYPGLEWRDFGPGPECQITSAIEAYIVRLRPVYTGKS